MDSLVVEVEGAVAAAAAAVEEERNAVADMENVAAAAAAFVAEDGEAHRPGNREEDPRQLRDWDDLTAKALQRGICCP